MTRFTPFGQDLLNSLSNRYGVSTQAVEALIIAVNNGGGSQAQFSHPELGGMGQWSYGGMTMVGDMFNNNLKALVDNLCTDISNALANSQVFEPLPMPRASQTQSQGNGASFMVMNSQNSSWPAELGAPSSTGAQNNLRYAFFPSTRRLAIDLNGHMTVYDTGDHQIGGVSQQQGGDQSIPFTSQYGTVRCADLPVVNLDAPSAPEPSPPPPPAPHPTPEPASQAVSEDEPTPEEPASPTASPTAQPTPASTATPSNEIFALIEQLANLHQKGILSDDEFSTKKAELLARL
ncbi:MAG: hypothetical protein CMK09_19140 [Ponticaulis sp.]|nr:hypothetical protein [Ponticaulis sp.]